MQGSTCTHGSTGQEPPKDGRKETKEMREKRRGWETGDGRKAR